MNNNKTIAVFIITFIVGLCLVTAVSAAVKPSINKTMVLQIEKYIKK